MLDTNMVIDVIKRRPVEVMEVFNQSASRKAISVITLSELLHGTKKSSQHEKNLRVVLGICSPLDVLDFTAKATYHFRKSPNETDKLYFESLLSFRKLRACQGMLAEGCKKK
ncbi:MAG: PIN domain-containing protein [Methylophilaceae bacterium]|nr:MAG: PIN domain-containing protein [Methylophilaceae bacterium]